MTQPTGGQVLASKHSGVYILLALVVSTFGTACSAKKTVQGYIESLTGPITTVSNAPLGNNAISFDPASHNFGTVPVNGVAEKKIIAKNGSSYSLSNLSIDPPAASGLQITHTTCSGIILKPNEQCEFILKYSPPLSQPLSISMPIHYKKETDTQEFFSSILVSGNGSILEGFSGLSAIDGITTTSMRLHWQAIESADSYQVYLINGSNLSQVSSLATGSACQNGGCSFVVSSLAPDSPYTFRVRATNTSGIQEGNTVNQVGRTKKVGSFAPAASLSANEGVTGITDPLSCTDEYQSPSTFAIVSQSDPTANCTLTSVNSPSARVSCTPAFASSAGNHATRSAQVTLECSINGSALTQNLAIQIEDTNRPPKLAVRDISNPSPVAGSDTASFSVYDLNSNGAMDIDGDPLSFSCAYSIGLVGGTQSPCASLPGTLQFNPSSGQFSWTPSTAAGISSGPTPYAFQITASDGQGGSDSAFAVVNVLPAMVITDIPDRTFQNNNPVRVGTPFSATFKNTVEQSSSSATSITYTCFFDRQADGAVQNASACDSLPGLQFPQGNTTGLFTFTPTSFGVGVYEFKVCGALSSGGSSCDTFVLHVSSAYATSTLLAYADSLFHDLAALIRGYGTNFNSKQSISFEQWVKPASPSTAGAALLSNASPTNGISITQSIEGNGKVQIAIGEPYSAKVLKDGALAYYKLNEPYGTAGADILGKYPAEFRSGTSGVLTPRAAGALRDPDPAYGVQGGASIRITPSLSTGTNPSPTGFSIETWFKITPQKFPATIFNIGRQGSSSGEPFYWLYTNTSGTSITLQAGLSNTGSWQAQSGSVTLASETWYHLVLSADTTSKNAKIFVNGNLVLDKIYTNLPIPSLSTPQTFVFGKYQDAAPTDTYNSSAHYDEIAIYPLSLSQAQVSEHYSARNAPSCTSRNPMLANSWNHLVGFFDLTTSSLGLLLNGVKECGAYSFPSTFSGSSLPLTFGATPSGSNPFVGDFSEIRIYEPINSSLASTTASDNFEATKDRYQFMDTPLTLNGLMSWFKADSIDLPDGSPVEVWSDSRTPQIQATQTDPAKRPLFKRAVLNGKPTVQFDAASKQFLDLGFMMDKPSNFSTFVVYRSTHATARQVVMGSSDASYSAATAWGSLELNSGSPGAILSGSHSNGTSSGVAKFMGTDMTNTFSILSSVYSAGASSSIPYVNGQLPVFTVAGSGATANSGAPQKFSFGRSGSYDDLYLSGDIAEVILYSRPTSLAERARIEAYLNSRYRVIP